MPPYHTHSPFVGNPSYEHAVQILLDADYMRLRTFTSDDPKLAPEVRFEVWHKPDVDRSIMIQVWKRIAGQPDEKGFTAYADWPIGSSVDALRKAVQDQDTVDSLRGEVAS